MNPICFTSDIFSPVSLSVPCSSVQCRPCISCSDNVNKTQLVTGFTLHTLFYFTSDIFGQDVQPCMQQIPVTHWIVKVLTHLKSSDQSLMTTSIADGPKTIQCFFSFFFILNLIFSQSSPVSLFTADLASPRTLGEVWPGSPANQCRSCRRCRSLRSWRRWRLRAGISSPGLASDPFDRLTNSRVHAGQFLVLKKYKTNQQDWSGD